MILTVTDLHAYDPDIDAGKAEAMIADVMAQALLCAPCLADEAALTDAQVAQFRSVLRAVVLRWNDQGPSGIVSTMDAAGSFTHQESVDNRQTRRGLFWPSEVDLLRKICGTTGRRSGTVDIAPSSPCRGLFPNLSIEACQSLGGSLPDDPVLGARIN